MLPLGFLTVTKLETQGVDSVTGVTIGRGSSRFSSSLRAVLRAIGTFRVDELLVLQLEQLQGDMALSCALKNICILMHQLVFC